MVHWHQGPLQWHGHDVRQYCSWRPGNRSHHHSASHADIMGASYAMVQEDSYCLRFWTRFCVWSLCPQATTFPKADRAHSIAAITSIRIKYFLQLDASDPLYSIWPDGVLSSLVPLLGILNANLLTSRPAMKMIFSSSKFLTKSSRIEDSSQPFTLLTDNSVPLSNIHGQFCICSLARRALGFKN